MPQQVIRSFLNDQSLFGGRFHIAEKRMYGARLFRAEKTPIIIEKVSFYIHEVSGVTELQIGIFKNRSKTEPIPEGLLSKVVLSGEVPQTPFTGWYTITLPAFELIDKSCWMVIWTKGIPATLYIAAPAAEGEAEGGFSQIKKATGETAGITEEPGQWITTPTSLMYGPFSFALAGPQPTPPPMSALRDIQPQHSKLLARWKLGDLTNTAVYEDASSFVMESYAAGEGPQKGRPGMNFNDDFYSTMGTIAASKKQYIQALEEKAAKEPFKVFGGVTVEAITAAEPNGSSFLLFGNSQFRVVIEGKNILFTLWAETTEAATTLTATNVLKGYPQLVDCTYESGGTTGLIRIWVDGAIVAEQAVTSFNILQSFKEENVKRKVTGTATLGKKTVTGVAASNIIGIGQHWVATASAPQRGFTTGLGLQAVTETSFELTQEATESGAVTFTIAYPATLLMPLAFSGSCEAVGQDIAVYGAPLSKAEIEARFKAFRQINTDARRL